MGGQRRLSPAFPARSLADRPGGRRRRAV